MWFKVSCRQTRADFLFLLGFQIISYRLYVLTKQWNPSCIILKNLGEKNFRKKCLPEQVIFLAEYMQGSCVLSNIIWNINLKNIVPVKILEKNRSPKHCKQIQKTIPGNMLKKVLSGLLSYWSSVRTSILFVAVIFHA